MELNIEEWAKEFITAYYTSVVYSPKEVVKFYDPENAKIYRGNQQDQAGIPLNESLSTLVPRLPRGDKLIITQYNTVPLDNGFNLSVFGKRISQETTTNFAQMFTLLFIHGRAVVVADSLQNLTFDAPDENFAEIPRPVKNARRKNNSNNIEAITQSEPTSEPKSEPKKSKPVKKPNNKNKYVYNCA